MVRQLSWTIGGIAPRSHLEPVGTGVGNPQSHAHAPNENIVVQEYVLGIKHMVLLFDRFGRS